MSPDTDTLNLIQTTFPGQGQLIGQVFEENGTFRELCEDYRRCVAALDRWKESTGTEASQRHQEYTELLMELGKEIETWLDASQRH